MQTITGTALCQRETSLQLPKAGRPLGSVPLFWGSSLAGDRSQHRGRDHLLGTEPCGLREAGQSCMAMSMDQCWTLAAFQLLLFTLLLNTQGHGNRNAIAFKLQDAWDQVTFMSNISQGKVEPSPEITLENEIQNLEDILGSVPYSDQNLSITMPYIQALMFKVNPNNFTGLNLTSYGTEKMTMRHAMSFPPEILKSKMEREYRLICVYFDSSIFFQDGKNSSLLNDHVLGATLHDGRVLNLSKDVEIRFWHQQVLDESNAQCVWWNSGKGSTRGNWSTEGCKTVHQLNRVLCLCNHLTYFAVLLQMYPAVLDARVLASLTYITYAGCSISAVASLLTILLNTFCRKRKSDYTTKIHMNLLGALFLLNVFFLANETLAKASQDVPGLCTAAAALLHCSLLCCFTWMGIEGFHLYLLLIKVYNIYIRDYLHKLCAVGWGLPVLTVVLILLIRREVYGLYEISTVQGYQNITMCWVMSQEVHTSLNLGYAGTILVFNAVIFAIGVKKIRTLRSKKGQACRDTLTMLGLTCLLGPTWALAFFSFGVLLLPQLFTFTILNSLQGFLIFLWYCGVQIRAGDTSISSPTYNTRASQ